MLSSASYIIHLPISLLSIVSILFQDELEIFDNPNSERDYFIKIKIPEKLQTPRNFFQVILIFHKCVYCVSYFLKCQNILPIILILHLMHEMSRLQIKVILKSICLYFDWRYHTELVLTKCIYLYFKNQLLFVWHKTWYRLHEIWIWQINCFFPTVLFAKFRSEQRL